MASHDPLAATRGYDEVLPDRPEDHEIPAGHAQPQLIGRYRVEKLLGKGGFGLVYLARDTQLDRLVAVKVPHSRNISRPDDVKIYLDEARTVASLDHPHIVPVHDVGSTPEFPCYIVSKFVDGASLGALIRKGRFSFTIAAEMIACIADALHYAHKTGIVHRDVKPGNILVDRAGKPYIVDFGLALLEHHSVEAFRSAGTPAYMSPEQARGEGHRVDGRSDIYSLGAVLYELLSGRRKTTSRDQVEILQQIITQDPKPPRQIDDRVPRELERICLKALSRRATDRYTTAFDFADDLRCYLRNGSELSSAMPTRPVEHEAVSFAPESTSEGEQTLTAPLRVVPKGLRSFDERDAGFFIELLPGARGRNGVPDSLQFWKSRIEETDPDSICPIGIIYGPSGCGKSSLVKAGLLPLLSEEITPVYIEATPDDTESRLLAALQRNCPSLASKSSLHDAISSLRRGGRTPGARKVLIVVDQFEQWLHTHPDSQNSTLVHALRQCDGVGVQCIVMVRDDFWMAVTRFMAELEVPIREGVNSVAVDLLPISHAEKVLAAFGRAFGALPADITATTPAHEDFIRQSVEALAEGGRVICVRLALFAEMIKHKPWLPHTLKEIGGAEGVGVTFLEEAFRSASAPLERRHHQAAAQMVLKSLLPASGTDIKGEMKSWEELLAASGYADKPARFVELMRILDSDMRLITPTDQDALDSGSSAPSLNRGAKFYQLTHDYLVPSLRIWLTRKQKETRRGRAELQLAEQTADWKARPEHRRLPTWWETASIWLHTDKRLWTSTERRMMRASTRYHGIRFLAGALLIGATTFAFRTYLAIQKSESEQKQASLLVSSLLKAPADAFPYALQNLEPLRDYASPLLMEIADDANGDPVNRIRAAAGLSGHGSPRSQLLVDAIPTAPPGESETIIVALDRDRDRAVPLLSEKLQQAASLQEKARLAIVLLQLGQRQAAGDMLKLQEDPTERALLINTLSNWHGPLQPLVEIVSGSDRDDLRSGLCLGIGSIPFDQIPNADRERLTRTLTAIAQDEADPGVHAAAGWLLRKWGLPEPEPQGSAAATSKRPWRINSQGMTLVRIAPRPMAPGESGPWMKPFWLSDREVSRELFQRFMDDETYPTELHIPDWKGADTDRSPTFRHPVQHVSWRDAVLFCNWLSAKENLRPCYTRVDVAQPGSPARAGVASRARPRGETTAFELDPDANGYRLPTEVEWAFACRAGTTTAFISGEDETLLPLFAVYESNHPLPCAMKMPNGWGLFDMHGSLYEWCHDLSPPPAERNPNSEWRVLRSGAYDYPSRFSQSSARERNVPTYRSRTIGFRPARND